MKRVGIIRGGISDEYQLSLKTGANVARALAAAGFEAIDMLLDKEGVLHMRGVPVELPTVKENVDTIWNALHGEFGEDGQLQAILDSLDIPYVGSGAEAGEIAFDKQKSKYAAESVGVLTPQSMLVMPEEEDSVSDLTKRIYHTMAPPWVLKPLTGSGSVRAYFAFTPLELSQFVDESVSHGAPFLVEQYIQGREAAVGVVNDFRNKSEYVLPVVEVKSESRGLCTYGARCAPEDYAVKGSVFNAQEREALSELARKLHGTLGAKDYSQSEFIIDNRGKIWFISIDTQPHLTDNAPFLVALDAVGSSLQEFVKSVIEKK